MRRAFPLVLCALIVNLPGPSTHAAGRPASDSAPGAPDPAAVERYGPAYRYPQAGWIVLHVEGQPYERGYQHGRLLAPEIANFIESVATIRSKKAPSDAWREVRTLVNALFLRRYDKEYLEEMKGIAEGAAAGGAKYDGRAVDLIDIVALNSDMEVTLLDPALHATANGLEGQRFATPDDSDHHAAPAQRCSAFAANGPATADGSIVFGHISMYLLPYVRHYNVWLDVEPVAGHRIVMQTSPGGIQSGMDYYINDAGMLISETTIAQTKFDSAGQSVASRIRKAAQYAGSIDQAVAILKTANNGMYTNEWLLADTKTNEIAMFELGTAKSKLWRSGNDEWVGGTKGFYWGCNNTKDLDVRLETVPSVAGQPANVVFHPHPRDLAWVRLYEKHKGKIGTDFGFEAFSTPPIVEFSSCDAKFTTSALAKQLKSWALFGPPLGRTWDPSPAERAKDPDVRPLVGNDWTLLTIESPTRSGPAVADSKVKRIADPKYEPAAVDLGTSKKADSEADATKLDPIIPDAWHGTLLPRTDGDVWLAAAFADYEKIVAVERALHAKAKDHKLTAADRERIDLALFAPHSRYRTAVERQRGDTPLCEIKASFKDNDWYDVAAGKGALLLADMRARLGDAVFVKFMDEFGRAHAGQEVSTAQFREAVAALPNNPLPPLFLDGWLRDTGLPRSLFEGYWSIGSYENDLDKIVIVYGTLQDADAQREAAERLQRQIARDWSNVTVPIVSDKQTDKEDLGARHILLIGRPETNALARRHAEHLPIRFGPASFEVQGKTYAHPGSAAIAAGPNPIDPHYSLVIYAGLSAEATWHCVEKVGGRVSVPAEVLLLPAEGKARRLAISGTAKEEIKAAAAD